MIDRQFALSMVELWQGLADELTPPVDPDPEPAPDPPVVVEPPVVIPPVVIEPPVVIIPASGVIPPLSECGPRGTLVPNYSSNLSGEYRGQKFTNPIRSIAPGSTLIDCELAWWGWTPVPDVTFLHCKLLGGLWSEGNHDGLTIVGSVVDGGARQCLRLKGAGKASIVDTWLFTHDTELDVTKDIHTETVQHLNGAAADYTRVGFSCEPRWLGSHTPITAVATFDGDSSCTDCTFGYFDGSTWSHGGGWKAIYPGASTRFIRPTIHAAPVDAFAPPGAWGARLVDPVYL